MLLLETDMLSGQHAGYLVSQARTVRITNLGYLTEGRDGRRRVGNPRSRSPPVPPIGQHPLATAPERGSRRNAGARANGDQWLSQRKAQTQAPPGGTKATRGPILPLAGTRDSTSLQGQ